MNILITGGTGFIGKELALELTKSGHKLWVVSRNPESHKKTWGLPSEWVKWDPEHEPCPISLDPFDAVVHLMGESIANGAWTAKQKHKIVSSRVKSTQNLGAALALRSQALPVFISASAIGYYPYDETEIFDEDSKGGDHFLAQVCKEWEAAVIHCPNVSRNIRLRFGVVIGANGGFLSKLITPARLGLLGTLGKAKQLMSWIHREDLIKIVMRGLSDLKMAGPINCVAPRPVTNSEFIETLSRVLQRPLLLHAPAFGLQLLLAEKADLLLGSQGVISRHLDWLEYSYPELEAALSDALNLHAKYAGGKKLVCQRLNIAQFIPRPVGEVFAFFSNPHHLESITPPLLQFKIRNISTPDVREATVIEYKLKVRGVPMGWRTLIRDWQTDKQFIDTQESGPYVIWHHTHKFFPVLGGTLMTDEVLYRLPLALLGEAIALPLVKRDVEMIFAYRTQHIAEHFGRHH